MFGIDFSEILVIFGIALVVLGPEKLPKLARTIGHWVGRARAMARQFREQLEQEADALQRSTDLHTPSATPHPAPPPTPAPAGTATIIPADAAAAAADIPEPHEQPASAPAEPHERVG
jgi:sec-independent protein translocase protein TatB